jgi:hypothetical protein
MGEDMTKSYHGWRWLPYPSDYVAACISEPENPDMRPEFAIWLRAVLAPQWLPADLPDTAPYLRVGKDRESRYRSCFYATYQIDGTAFMVKGYLDRVEVTIKPPAANLPAAVAAAFQEAAGLDQSREPGMLGIPQSYEGAGRELQSYLRGLAEEYVNPASCPQDEMGWTHALSLQSTYNAGFTVDWLTRGYTSYAAPGGPQSRPENVSVVVWTNGRALRIVIDHSDIWVHSFKEYLDSFPQPVPAPVELLNPEAAQLWDRQMWGDDVAPVSNPERATRASIGIVVKPPYAPIVGVEGGGRESDGAPRWGCQVLLPLTPLKWQVLEFAGLITATKLCVSDGAHQYDASFTERLGAASDRNKVLEEASAHRAACDSITDRFAALRYPAEMQDDRDALLGALQANRDAWGKALAFWGPVVRDYPDASESFYRLRGDVLSGELMAAGLGGTDQRIEDTPGFSPPVFRRFGIL